MTDPAATRSAAAAPPAAVVIPHHSQRELLQRALASAQGWPVFLVDDSPAGLPPQAKPTVHRLLRTAGSSGFAAACNAGLEAAQQAGFQWALLLNDDACLQPGCLEALLAAAGAHPDARALGPVLLDEQGQVESAGIRLHEHSGRIRLQQTVPRKIQAVHALSGACLLLESSQRFDERFHFGFEDLELCRRLRRRGHSVLLVPSARCVHRGGGTVPHRSREASRRALHGHLLLVGERPWRRPLVLAMALGQVLREGGPPERLLGLWQGWRDARKG